jgi:hypothetical protein
MAEYTSIYETILSKYEAKLKNADLLDYNFPDPKFTVQTIDPLDLNPAPSDDQELIDTLLKEYHTCLDYLKDHFK